MKFNKYNNKRTVHHGRSFMSQGEADLYSELLLLEKAGLIKDIQCQDTVYLTDARIQYNADFKVYSIERDQFEWIEFKGFETDVWRIKRRLWISYGPGTLHIYKKSGKKIYLYETIVPKT